MKLPKNFFFYAGFLFVSALFLFIEHLTHLEFFLHLAAIPLEVLLAVFIVEKLLERRESKEKRRQLMFIKSYMFRSDMRNLFVANFAALERPAITWTQIKSASLDELRRIRNEAESVKYKSDEAIEPVIMEYVKAKPVWTAFLERAITSNFEDIFQDMISILHFIQDVKAFKERNPGEFFIHEARKREWLMERVKRVLGDGIRKFLDYAIELKEKQPAVFTDVIRDYEFSSHIHQIKKR